MDVINDIKLFVKKGYSNEEIKEILDVSDDDINNVRISYMHIDTPPKNKFSKNCINVFCKFLDRGISDEQLYDLFNLRKKCKREEFYKLCQSLRKGEIHKDITSQYNIPIEPYVTLDLDRYKKDKPQKKKNIPKKVDKTPQEQVREIARKKREKENRIIAEAIERKEKEDIERAEYKKRMIEKKKEEEDSKTKLEQESTELFGSMREPTYEEQKCINRYIDNISVNTGVNFNRDQKIPEEEPLPVLDTTPTNINHDSKIHKVCTLLNKGYSYEQIQKVTGVPISTITRIHNGEAFTDISVKYGILSKETRQKMQSIFKDI